MNRHQRNFRGKFTSQTMTMVYFFMIWKIKADLYELLAMNKDFRSKKYER